MRGLGPAALAELAAGGRSEAVARHGIVALDAPRLAVVTGGYFRIFRHAAFVRDVTLGLAAAGDVLAAGALFGDRPAETGAQALSDGSVLFASLESFHACAQRDPELYLRLAASLGARLERVQRTLEEQTRAGVTARVARALADLAADFGCPVAGGAVRLDLPLAQDDLARLAGTTRETCSSAVAEIARRGLVKGRRLRGLVVLDPAGLEALAGGGAGFRP